MPRNGTTKDQIRSRRARSEGAARLTAFFRRTGKVLIVLVIAGWAVTWLWLGGGFARAGQWAEGKFHESAAAAGFALAEINVEGRKNVDKDVILALVNVPQGESIFLVNPHDLQEMIERISWVKSARVERRLPGELYISLTERVPVALWQHKQKIRLIDAEGVTLDDTVIGKYGNLAIVVGENAPVHAAELLKFLDAESEVKTRLEAASWVGDRRWDLMLKGGLTVKLPEDDIGLALRRLAAAQESDAVMDGAFTVLDLREADRITVTKGAGEVSVLKVSAPGRKEI